MDTGLLARAKAVAERSLRANMHRLSSGRTVVSAGARQFRSVWTRDFCFASGGLLSLGEASAVRDTLDEILSNRRPDGLYPRLLDSYGSLTHFSRALFKGSIPLAAPLHPNFTSDHLVLSIDSNALTVWTAGRYALHAGDRAWAESALPALKEGMRWYQAVLAEGLVQQPPFSDWKDTIAARRGAVFFTQLLFWQAQRAMASLLDLTGKAGESPRWRHEADALAARMREEFWDEAGGFFKDTVLHPVFSSDGNLAAIAWGFATEEEAERILKALDRLGLMTPIGPRAAQPYPLSEKGWLSLFAGIRGYHDGFVWVWNSALALRALRRAGMLARREALLEGLCRMLEAQGELGEVYHADATPVRTWLYRSESPFSWSSGMFLEAVAEVPES